MTVISWQACLASSAFLGGTMIQGLLVLNDSGYKFERWHGTLLFYAIISFSLFINTYLARLLPKIEAMVLVIHIAGFVCILVPLVYLAPHGSAKDVFATFNNGGGWNTEALSFFIGIPTAMFAFIGMCNCFGCKTRELTTCRIRCSFSHGSVGGSLVARAFVSAANA